MKIKMLGYEIVARIHLGLFRLKGRLLKKRLSFRQWACYVHRMTPIS
jgi:hypothetical protein